MGEQTLDAALAESMCVREHGVGEHQHATHVRAVCVSHVHHVQSRHAHHVLLHSRDDRKDAHTRSVEGSVPLLIIKLPLVMCYTGHTGRKEGKCFI